MQIKELERELKVVLVERRRQGMQLTEEGREVARRAARIVTDVRDLVDYAHHRNSTLSGPLHLGVIPSVAPYLLPPLLPVLRDRYPDLELHLRETRTDQLLAELADGKLDVLVLALPVEGHDIETLALFEDPFFLAVPSSHKLSGKVRATPELLAQRSPAPARGGALPARAGARLLPSAAGRAARHVRRLQPVHHRADGGAWPRHHPAARGSASTWKRAKAASSCCALPSLRPRAHWGWRGGRHRRAATSFSSWPS